MPLKNGSGPSSRPKSKRTNNRTQVISLFLKEINQRFDQDFCFEITTRNSAVYFWRPSASVSMSTGGSLLMSWYLMISGSWSNLARKSIFWGREDFHQGDRIKSQDQAELTEKSANPRADLGDVTSATPPVSLARSSAEKNTLIENQLWSSFGISSKASCPLRNFTKKRSRHPRKKSKNSTRQTLFGKRDDFTKIKQNLSNRWMI